MFRIALILLVIFISKNIYAAEISNIIIDNKENYSQIKFLFKEEIPQFSISQKEQKVKILFKDTTLKNPAWIIDKGLIQSIDYHKEGDLLLIEIGIKDKVSIKNQQNKNYLIVSMKPKIKNETFPYELPPIPQKIQIPFSEKKYKGKKISLDLQNADVQTVFRILSEIGGVNIVLGENIQGKVTLKLKEVPWDQVLDIIMARFGLGKVTIDGIIYVAPLKTLQARAEELKSLKRTLVEGEDLEPLVTEYISVNYLNACELLNDNEGSGEPLIKTLITNRGSVSCDQRTNTIIIKDTAEAIKAVKELVNKLDIPTKQVLIEARIVEVSSNFARNLGIQWFGGYYKTNDTSSFRIGPSTQIPHGDTGRPAQGGIYDSAKSPFGPIVDLGVPYTSKLGFGIAHITKSSALLLDMHLSALEQEGLGKVVSSPRIITRDNGEALIRQGYKIPYPELTSEGTVATEFVDVDLALKVVPHILVNNEIRLEITIDKSEPDWSREVNGVPAIMRRSAETYVRVPNGGTVVIGGLKVAKKYEAYDRVPGISKVPGVGNLFKNSQRSEEDQELLIFITAKVISTAVEEVDY